MDEERAGSPCWHRNRCNERRFLKRQSKTEAAWGGDRKRKIVQYMIGEEKRQERSAEPDPASLPGGRGAQPRGWRATWAHERAHYGLVGSHRRQSSLTSDRVLDGGSVNNREREGKKNSKQESSWQILSLEMAHVGMRDAAVMRLCPGDVFVEEPCSADMELCLCHRANAGRAIHNV